MIFLLQRLGRTLQAFQKYSFIFSSDVLPAKQTESHTKVCQCDAFKTEISPIHNIQVIFFHICQVLTDKDGVNSL